MTDEKGASVKAVVNGKVTHTIPAIPITPSPTPEPAPTPEPEPVVDPKPVPVEDNGKPVVIETGESVKDDSGLKAAGLGAALLALGGSLITPFRRMMKK